MRVFLFSLLTLTNVIANAVAPDAAVTRFLPLAIDENSVRVVASRQIQGATHEITIEFKILPNDSAEENYAGLQQAPGLPKFQAVYAFFGQPRVAPGKPRRVVAKFTVNLNRAGMPLDINGATYGLQVGPNEGQIQIYKMSSAKRK